MAGFIVLALLASCGGNPKKSCGPAVPLDSLWVTDYTEGMLLATAQQKPALVYFTGYACVPCRRDEDQLLSDPCLQAAIRKDFVWISVFVDDRRDSLQLGKQWQMDCGGGNLQPCWMVINPRQQVFGIYDHTFSSGNPPADMQKFTRFLDSALIRYKSGTPVSQRKEPVQEKTGEELPKPISQEQQQSGITVSAVYRSTQNGKGLIEIRISNPQQLDICAIQQKDDGMIPLRTEWTGSNDYRITAPLSGPSPQKKTDPVLGDYNVYTGKSIVLTQAVDQWTSSTPIKGSLSCQVIHKDGFTWVAEYGLEIKRE